MDALLDQIKDQPLALLAFGAVVALIFGIRYLGLWQGQKAVAKPLPSSTAEVAAIIVDAEALNRASAAVEALNMTLIEQNKLAKDGGKASAADTDRVIREIGQIHVEIRALSELVRPKP